MKTSAILRLIAAALALPLLLTACGEAPDPRVEEAETVVAPPATVDLIQIRDASNEVTAVFKLETRPLIILRGAERQVFVRRQTKKDIRWFERGGEALLLVEKTETGFRLRRPSSEVAWRLSLNKRRITGFRGSEKEPAFVLRTRKQMVRVASPPNQTIGRATINKSGGTQIVNAAGELVFRSPKAPSVAMFGPLLIPVIDPLERHVLMAEILLRHGTK